ncbi:MULTISPECIES: hypothetical protein [Rhizobium]|uniref:hypothetical protein n=1 Tax=Rhizobium TaxID=379 RepID=UPI001C8357FE|nr:MULTISPECIES: hypothetical protein [Rhizobium]MBX4897442.1 hypothetical protein [Rhizobium bangladeshense]MBX5015967.1 hypothetical protein [Rhizobium lentis]
MARAIHEARAKREPEWKGTWQDCVDEAEAADKAAYESRPFRYDASEDFSHHEPI